MTKSAAITAPAILLGLLALAAFLVVGGRDSASAASVSYTFDGAPSSPKSFYYDPNFDVQVSSRDTGSFKELDPVHAEHGPGCEGPTVTHMVTAYEDAVFNCRDHMMTTMAAEGYGVIYFTPNARADWSGGESVIRFDVSTKRGSTSRDWWDVWVTPYGQNLTLPLEPDTPDGQGPAQNAIQVRLTNENALCVNDWRNFNNVAPGPWSGSTCAHSTGYERFITPDSAIRTPFEIRITKTSVKVSMLDANGNTVFTWHDYRPSSPFAFTDGVVQIGHHSYNPNKDGGGPATYHWDNLSISPAKPFTIVRANQRYVEDNGTVNFAAPAPANSKLRFSGIGSIDVSFDNGATWTKPQRQPQAQSTPEHFSAYFTPVPAGTTNVKFRFGGDGWYQGPFMAKDLTFWADSSSGGSAPQPTATRTATPAPTTPAATATTPAATATTPAATATTPAATATATRTATPTRTATNTPVPTSTATPPPSNSQPPTSPGAGTRINWNGGQWYLNGANLPWYNWGCDFGCGTSNGASNSANKAAISQRLAEAKAAGMTTIRWWVFPGDPWQITRDGSGKPTGINAAVYQDLDTAVALAEQHDLYLNLVLFSGPTAVPSKWMTDGTQRQALADVLGQLAGRYKNNKRILAWEIVNEPEFDIWNGKIQQKPVQDTVRAIANSINAATPANTTVGSAMLDGLSMWTGMGLDFYQAHWYDYMNPGNWCAMCTDYNTVKRTYNLDAPLVLGEVYLASDVNARQRMEDFYAKGYAGAWGWSLFPEKTSDRMTVDMTASSAFARSHGDIGPKAGGSTSPSPTATRTATATPTRTATPPSATSTPTKTATAAPTKTATSTPTATPTQPRGRRTRSSTFQNLLPGFFASIVSDAPAPTAVTTFDSQPQPSTGGKVRNRFATLFASPFAFAVTDAPLGGAGTFTISHQTAEGATLDCQWQLGGSQDAAGSVRTV